MKILISVILLPLVSFCQNEMDSTILKSISKQTEKLTKVVINVPTQVKEIGFHNLRKTFLPTRTYCLSKNYTGIYVKNPQPDKVFFIKELIMETVTKRSLKNDIDRNAKVRLRIYKFDPISKTIEEILLDDILVEVPQGSHTLRVDIEKKNVPFPAEGLFLAFKLVEKSPGRVCIRYGNLKKEEKEPIYFLNPKKNRLLLLSNSPETEKNFALMVGLSIKRY